MRRSSQEHQITKANSTAIFGEALASDLDSSHLEEYGCQLLQYGDDLTSPPCWIMTRLPPSAPPQPEASLMPDRGPCEVSATATAPPPALPEFVEPPFGQAPIPVTEASGQHSQDPAPAEPPKLYPPLLISRMPSSAYTSPLHHSPSLPLNEKIQSGAPDNKG